MPKIPTTSKRARTFLNAEPLVPPSIKSEAAVPNLSAQSAPPVSARRSSRLAAAVKSEPLLDHAEGPLKSVKAEQNVSSASRQPDKVRAKSTTHNKAIAKPVAVKEEHVQVEPPGKLRPKFAKSGDKAPPVEKKERGSKSSRAGASNNPEKSMLTELTEPTDKPEVKKRKRKAMPLDADGNDPRGAAKLDRVKSPRAKGANKKPKRSKAESKVDVEELEGEKDTVAAEGKSKKTRTKSAAAFAIRSEEIEDTQEARRARIKASILAEKNGVLERALVLENDIERMCKELGNDRLGETAPWQNTGGSIGGLKWWTGCHCSSSGGVDKAVINAAATGCRAFALDVRCKVRWDSPPLTQETIHAFKEACHKFGYGPEQILPHGSYLINLASPDPEMAKKGYGGFLEELQRCELLGLTMYNFHPGSTTGLCTHEESMDRIAGFINDAHKATKGVTVVLENMSSVGNIVGGKMWHLKYIIDRVEDKSRIGFCIDTCHLFSSGVDLRTKADCEAAVKHIDDVIGLQYLRGLHVNDSKTPFDSHRDRHENIGRGSIPMTCFKWIMNNPRFQGIPLIMETPVQEREAPVDFKKSLQHARLWWKDPNGPYGVGTDRRDIILLNSLIQGASWD